MGTNYYAHVDDDRLHITKTSAGWVPLIEIHDDHYTNFAELVRFVNRDDVTVKDEYGETADAHTFIGKLVTWKHSTRHERHHEHPAYDDLQIFDGFDWTREHGWS